MSDIKACRESSQAQPLAAVAAVEQAFAAAHRCGFPLRMVIAHSEATAKAAGKEVKRPVEYRWNRIRPSLDECVAALNAGYLLGVVPESIGKVLVDIDAGDGQDALEQARKPIARVPSFSGRPGREHFWYPAGEKPPANRYGNNRFYLKLDGGGIEGDIIHSHPYGLTHHYLHLLALIIGGGNAGDSGDGEFPHDLFPHTLKPTAPPDAVAMQRYWKPTGPASRIDLRTVKRGEGRNTALFIVLCWWNQICAAEYRAGRIKTMADLLLRAVELNQLFPEPMAMAEVEKIVKSAWKYLRRDGGIGPRYKWNWTWDSDNQRNRQPKRWRAHNAARLPLKERAVALSKADMSSAQIERKIGVPARTIRRWLRENDELLINRPEPRRY